MAELPFDPNHPFRLSFHPIEHEGRAYWQARMVPHPELIKMAPEMAGEPGMCILLVPLRAADEPELREKVIELAKAILATSCRETLGTEITFGEAQVDLERIPTKGSG